MVDSLVRLHIRHQRGTHQGQANFAPLGADPILAVIEHRRPGAAVVHRGIAVVAHLVLVPVMLPGTVGGTAEITELDLLDGIPGVNRHGEGRFQQFVPLVPV